MRITAGEPLHVDHINELQAFVYRHGQDPGQVRWAEDDVIDLPLLRFGVYLSDEYGNRYLDENQDVALKVVETPLKGPLPPWWKE